MASSCPLLLLLQVVAAALSLAYPANAGSSHHLTAGFSRVKLSESQFVVQKPYDVPLKERYEQSGGVRRMWVFATDKTASATHPGGVRTEIKVDVFGAATHATTLMLRVYELTKVVADRVYDWWIRLNVIHDVAAGNVTIFVDGERRLGAPGQGGKEHYFKFGMYKQSHPISSHRMESHWKNVAVYTKP